MKNKFTVKVVAVLLGSSILFSSCLGSFNLTRKLYAWNNSVGGDKWVNELLFIALNIVPVYSVAVFIDGVILNSIEFWTDENPIMVQTQEIKTEHGVYTVTTDTKGHTIRKEGSDEIIAFHFNAEEHSWSLESRGQSTPLVQFMANHQAKVYLADGSTLTVSTDQAGVLALKQAVAGRMFLAFK